jgi:hypothetical protein
VPCPVPSGMRGRRRGSPSGTHGGRGGAPRVPLGGVLGAARLFGRHPTPTQRFARRRRDRVPGCVGRPRRLSRRQGRRRRDPAPLDGAAEGLGRAGWGFGGDPAFWFYTQHPPSTQPALWPATAGSGPPVCRAAQAAISAPGKTPAAAWRPWRARQWPSTPLGAVAGATRLFGPHPAPTQHSGRPGQYGCSDPKGRPRGHWRALG